MTFPSLAVFPPTSVTLFALVSYGHITPAPSLAPQLSIGLWMQRPMCDSVPVQRTSSIIKVSETAPNWEFDVATAPSVLNPRVLHATWASVTPQWSSLKNGLSYNESLVKVLGVFPVSHSHCTCMTSNTLDLISKAKDQLMPMGGCRVLWVLIFYD